MPDGYFITFRPTEGVFEQTIKPYRIWRKRSDMSRWIDIDGRYYRVVRTIGLTRKLWVEKMAVCDANGRIVEDEDITRRCFRLIFHLGYYQFNQTGIEHDATYKEGAGGRNREEIIDLFRRIWTRLDPMLSNTEQEDMAYHLNFMQEMYRLEQEASEASKQVLEPMREILNRADDTYPTESLARYIDAAAWRYRLKRDLEALIIERWEKGGDKTKDIVLKDEYFEYLTDLKFNEELQISRDINNLTANAETFISFTKIDKERESYKKWLGDVSGPFTVEKHIYELRHVDNFERAMQMNIISALNNNWVLSPDCKFK